MNLNYSVFYKDYVVRELQHLSKIAKSKDDKGTRVVPLNELHLPKNAIWHYLGSGDNPLPSENHPLLKGYKQVYAQHVVDIHTTMESFILKRRDTSKFATAARQKHGETKIKYLHRLPELVKSKEDLIIETYGFLDEVVEYTSNSRARF